MTTEEARWLVARFGGFFRPGDQDPGVAGGYLGSYGFTLTPYLPHGSPAFCCGG